MCRRLIILMGALLILIVPGESKTSLIRSFLKLTEADNPNQKPMQMPPSPSPDSNTNGSRTDSQKPHNSPKEKTGNIITDERCETSSSSKWCRDLKNMTVCLPYPGSGPQRSFFIVQNDEDNSLKVNWRILPSNITFEMIELQKHQAMKINISAIIVVNDSIVLNAGNGDCTIHIGSPAPEENPGMQIPFVIPSMKPIHGAYLLALILLVSGGAWGCYKFSKRGRHLDGVPYQELEMGLPESMSAVRVEAAEGWDEDWDDDWDEEKAVMSPGTKRLRNVQANGVTSRSSNGDRQGKD